MTIKTIFSRFILFLFFISCPLITAQNVSKKQDIAVFSLSYYGWLIPGFLYNGIDGEIMKNFFALERFNIIAMEHRLYANDLETFSRAVLNSREANTQIPEEVLMGHESFTRQDWEKTINSYYTVVPIVQNYTVQEIEKKEGGKKTFSYKVKFAVEFHIYSIEKKEKIAFFTIEESMTGKNLQEAVELTISLFGIELERALRGIEDFKIKTGVIKTENKKVYFELGENIGVKKGDEYVVIGYDEDNNEKETGFLVVTETEQDFSSALTLYANPKIVMGDQLKEVPRLPVEFRLAFAGEFGLNFKYGEKSPAVFQAGLHISQTRGFYRFRPCYAIEAGFSSGKNTIKAGIPVSILIGTEIWNTYFGKMQILPTVQVFYTTLALIEKTSKWKPAEAGIKVFVHTSRLITRDVKLGVDIGFKAGIDLRETAALFFRAILGVGLTVKF